MFITKNSKNGFSLPEILIVLLTVAILVVLAVPQMNTSFQLNRIQTGATLISNKLQEAKMIAIKQNKQVSFVLDENSQKVWLEVNSTIIGTVTDLPNEIKIKITPGTSATKEYVTFNSMGALVTTPSEITPYYETKRLEIPVTVTISGKIAVETMRSY